jgi:hypothetical protein
MEGRWPPIGLPLQLYNLICACLPQIETRIEGKRKKSYLSFSQRWSFAAHFLIMSQCIICIVDLSIVGHAIKQK